MKMTQIHMKEKAAIDLSEVKMTEVNGKRRWFLVGMLGLVVAALVIGATTVGIFVGRSMTRDIYGEAWATFHNTATGTTKKQRFVVDGQEVAIIKPGELTVILDYDKNHVVMQVDEMPSYPTNGCLCFVNDFDSTLSMNFEELVKTLQTGNVQEEGSFPVKQSALDISEQQLTLSNLSKRSVEMCDGCIILQGSMGDAKDAGEFETRQRRSATSRSYSYAMMDPTGDGVDRFISIEFFGPDSTVNPYTKCVALTETLGFPGGFRYCKQCARGYWACNLHRALLCCENEHQGK